MRWEKLGLYESRAYVFKERFLDYYFQGDLFVLELLQKKPRIY